MNKMLIVALILMFFLTLSLSLKIVDCKNSCESKYIKTSFI